MPSNKPRNHHYVPQWYLARFAVKKKIWMFGRDTGNVFRSDIRRVASINDFHTLPSEAIPPGDDPFALERAFSELEGQHAEAVKTLIQTAVSGRVTGYDLRLRVAHAVAFQWVRTVQFRSQTRDMFDRGLRDITELLPPRTDMRIQFEREAERIRSQSNLLHLSIIADMRLVETFAKILTEHRWFLVRNETQHRFITSDSPVVLDSTVQHPKWMGVGIGSLGARIFYPLSPEWLLWTNSLSEPEHDVEPTIFTLNDDSKVKRINVVQVGACERWAYSRDGNFSFIEEFKQGELV